MSTIIIESAMEKSRKIVDAFEKQKKTMYIGVPCGILKTLFEELETTNQLIYAPREDNAIAMACGVHMAGKHPIVLMQNSGFAQSINVISSLVIPFKIPVTMIISLRGTGNDNTPENESMGRLTINFLESLNINYKLLNKETYLEDLEWAKVRTEIYEEPVALLINPEFFDWSPSE